MDEPGNPSDALATAEYRLRLAQADEVAAIARYRKAVGQAQESLASIKRELGS